MEKLNKIEMPFGDFRNIPIIPNKEELMGPNESKIRPNIINGKYLNVNQYLDIHFRLLREDFLAPLRDDIRNYLSSTRKDNKNLDSKIKTYNIFIKSETVVEQNRFYFVVGLQITRRKLKLLENSKELRYGSLVIFTRDLFQTIIIGSVFQKDEDTLENGDIYVEPLNIINMNKYMGTEFLMIEATSYFESYRHILKALQQMDGNNFPMSKYILQADVTTVIPAYLTTESFENILYKWKYADLKYNITQYEAIIAALTHEFCIIQGPPGTGKTFIGLEIIKTLLDNQTLWFCYGPILIVCKTNHALDQFLERISKMTGYLARVGGQSTNEKLNEFNLKQLRKNYKNNPSKSLKIIREQIKHIQSCILMMKTQPDSILVNANFHDEGPYWNGLDCSPQMEMDRMLNHLENLKNKYDDILRNTDLEILRRCLVVGMTTTGAAKNRKILEGLRSPIVFVEEAAEVLESHIVTSLTPDCKHLILIGDHKQLRPSTADYRMAKNYKLDISLFERMIKNGMHCATLGVQYRMRPEFAQLIAPSIYPNLKNDRSVNAYPSILGLTKNLFFIRHTHFEEEMDAVSNQNNHEAGFIIQLCRYLILQGYGAKDITILSTYNGQVHLMNRLKQCISEIHDVRITSVDNFQGEECNIILLSLVRSNRRGEIGFLKAENRICVALSRAKHGFYIIGNMDILVKHTKSKWPEINKVLIDNKSIGTNLELQCQIHNYQRTYVNCADNFMEKCPEGGCLLRCNAIMPCGHLCDKTCHVQDRNHIKVKCLKPCIRKICARELHQCRKLCHQNCDECYCTSYENDYNTRRTINTKQLCTWSCNCL